MNKMKSELRYRLQEAMNIRGKRAADLCRDLNIPKSAISQYLSGKSQSMDSERTYLICKYLDISEPWLMGYDVPMELHKKNDTISDVIIRLRTDSDFLSLVETLHTLDKEKIHGVKQMLSAFLK